jgi:uncharacterized membrane protein (DUF485 family)
MPGVVVDFKQNVKAARQVRLPWWVLLCMFIAATLSAALFDHFGRLYLMLPVLNCIVTLGFLIAVKWNLRQHAWFWITMIVMAALHVPLILYIPWTTKWVPALAIGAIDSVDFCVILALLTVVRDFMEVRNPLNEDRRR